MSDQVHVISAGDPWASPLTLTLSVKPGLVETNKHGSPCVQGTVYDDRMRKNAYKEAGKIQKKVVRFVCLFVFLTEKGGGFFFFLGNNGNHAPLSKCGGTLCELSRQISMRLQ